MKIRFTDNDYFTHTIEPYTKYKDKDEREFLIIDMHDDEVNGYVWLVNLSTEEQKQIHLETFKRYVENKLLERVPPQTAGQLKAA